MECKEHLIVDLHIHRLLYFILMIQADIPESDRYGLIGLVLGLKNKDLSLATENLLKVRCILIKLNI